ncbi:flagellar hook-associated protein FlgL [Heyndrickxia ginsengihumi]|uniref:flagellar hook-associated protein FlgL n=1 Tax=Heyndrickxia ginsengihumi TaxID=363870 RepID=UPI00203CF31F|nr:flagellar hook-associated protein FlgL [Heyndrickxia ginsengihumi]MCM3024044.1 flagellar hook-associated protein FlgL [Heyndrickxia ginsengihumi]
MTARVTQSMLASNFLNNLSKNYQKLATDQQQLSSGKKINRLSDDPLSAMKGISYRRTVNEIKQFESNFSEADTWTQTTNDALSEANDVLQRVRELTVEASNGTLTDSDKQSITDELGQLRDQLVTVANTKVGDKYIFNGTDTTNKPISVDASTIGTTTTLNINNQPVKIELSKGIYLQVNADGSQAFSNSLFSDLNSLISDLNSDSPSQPIDSYLSKIDAHTDDILTQLSLTGARSNRIDFMRNLVSQQEDTASEIMSNNEDADIPAVYTQFSQDQSVYTAALKIGAQVIQPSLVDFLK